MKLVTQNHSLFVPEHAVAVAAKNQADDNLWTYEAIHPKGSEFAYIEVRDETGMAIGRL